MNYREKLEHFAKANRITVCKVHQIEDFKTVSHFCGKLKGKIVSTEAGYKFNSKDEAWQNAFNFRASCIEELHALENEQEVEV